ncbi:hypothetical protein CNY89_06200 [Amaricoccus sp. HAR-UPW-R2A-40]|nr:hypothetical protein CNY89_06200 [Amaricoccus sp. HAR-UPW-R2A-40]
MTSTEILRQPFALKSLKLKNRIVMAPMTRNFAPEGVPGAPNAAYYRRRAEADVGLILSEGTVIDRPAARNLPAIPFFHGAEALAGWKRVIDGVHAVGGRMGPQIWQSASQRRTASPTPTGRAERHKLPSLAAQSQSCAQRGAHDPGSGAEPALS